MELVLDEGRLDSNMNGKIIAIQLLYGFYNLQNWCEHDEQKDIYLYTHKEEGKEENFMKLEEPLLTQWWLVSKCACSSLASQSAWKQICTRIQKSTKSDTATYKVALATYQLIDETIIMLDVNLLATIHT